MAKFSWYSQRTRSFVYRFIRVNSVQLPSWAFKLRFLKFCFNWRGFAFFTHCILNEFLSHDKHHVRKQRVSWCQGPLCGSPELLFSSFPPKINAILIYNMNWLSEAICGFHIKWNHMLCLSLCLTSFNQQYVSENHMSWCI